MKHLPVRGLDGAPYSFEQVAGGSVSQNSHRTLDTYGGCGSIPLAPRVLARHLALGKAKAAAARHADAIVIGADTFVVYRGALLGKPHTPKRAIEMLEMLSGKTHTILTGFAVVDSKTGKHISKTVGTRVTFRKLSAQEIAEYVKTEEPLKAAGAYVIQGNGARLIEKTAGDRNNIAGLPLSAVLEALGKFGVEV